MAATTADFYIQASDGSLEWIGSKGFDGYPWNEELKCVIEATTRPEYEQALVKLAESSDDFTRQEQGYPFGRKSSAESPYTYVWVKEGYVAIYKKGRPSDEDFPVLKFPKLDGIRQSNVAVKAKGAGITFRPESDDERNDTSN